MQATFRVRLFHAGLAMAYALVALAAMARLQEPMPLVFGATGFGISYFSAKTQPDIVLPLRMMPVVAVVGLGVLALGIAADVLGSAHHLIWAAIVMACGAGNRLRAAGIGPAG